MAEGKCAAISYYKDLPGLKRIVPGSVWKPPGWSYDSGLRDRQRCARNVRDPFKVREGPARVSLAKISAPGLMAGWEGNGGEMHHRVIAVLFLILNFGVCPVMPAGQLRSPSLSEVVLIGLRPVKELNPADFPQAQQVCAQKYLDAIAPDSGLWVFETPSSPDEGVLARRRNLIDQIVAILGQNVRSEAEAFANAVPLRSEWEGMSEGPVDEANFADNWLSKRPGTSIAPFLHLFKAHRFRAGYEAARGSVAFRC